MSRCIGRARVVSLALASFLASAIATSISCGDSPEAEGGDVDTGGAGDTVGDAEGDLDATSDAPGDAVGDSGDAQADGDGADDLGVDADAGEDATDSGGDPCEGDPCGAHGTCTSDGAGFECECSDDFSGTLCELCLPANGCGEPWVLLVGDMETDGTSQIHAAPLADGTFERVNSPLEAGESVLLPRVSPDGNFITYAGTDSGGTRRLFVHDVGGSGGRELSGPIVAGGNVGFGLQFAADGRVVYGADADTAGVFELYSVPLAGGEPTRVNPALAAGRAVTQYAVTPDGARVVYIADQELDEVFELYSAPSAGGGPAVRLNEPLVDTGDVSLFAFTGDSAHVVFTAIDETTDLPAIYAAPADGSSGAVLLSTPGRSASAMRVAGEAGPVVFRQAEPGQNAGLYSRPVDGSGEVVELVPPPSQGGIDLNLFVSPDGAFVLFRCDRLPDTAEADMELCSVPVAGGELRILTDSPFADPQIRTLVFTPDGTHALFVGRFTNVQRDDLNRVPVDEEGQMEILSHQTEATATFGASVTVSPDGAYALFMSNIESAITQLYVAEVDGGGPPVRLNAELVAGGVVQSYDLSDDGALVIYIADQEVDERAQAYVVPIGGGEPEGIGPEVEGEEDVATVAFFTVISD